MRNSIRLIFPLLLVLVLACLCTPALADDLCVVNDATRAGDIATDSSYLCVKCPLEGEQEVTMSVYDAWGYLVHERNYGLRSGSFRSADVYLPLHGASTVYTVYLQTGSETHAFRVTRIQPRMTDPGACAQGLPLEIINEKARTDKSAVIIDVDAMEGSTFSAPLISAGMQIGYASFTVEDGALSVSALLTVDGEIEKATVYVARDAVTALSFGSTRFTGEKAKLNRDIDLRGTPYAAVLLQLTVSYDEATAQPIIEDELYLEMQLELWEMMLLTTASEALG